MTDMVNGLVAGAHSPYLSWTDAAGTKQRLVFDLVETEEWQEDAEVTEHPVEVGADVADHVRVQLVRCRLSIFATNEPIDVSSGTSPDQATVATVPLHVKTPSQDASSPGTLLVSSWDNQIMPKVLAATAGGFLLGMTTTPPRVGPVTIVPAVLATVAADLLFQGQPSFDPVQVDSGPEPPAPRDPIQVRVQTWPGGTAGTDYVEALYAQLKVLKDGAQLLDVFGSKCVGFSMVIESLAMSRSDSEGTGAALTVALKEVRVVSTQTVVAPIPNLPAGGGAPPQNKGEQDPQDAAPAQKQSLLKYLQGHPDAIAKAASLFGI